MGSVVARPASSTDTAFLPPAGHDGFQLATELLSSESVSVVSVVGIQPLAGLANAPFAVHIKKKSDPDFQLLVSAQNTETNVAVEQPYTIRGSEGNHEVYVEQNGQKLKANTIKIKTLDFGYSLIENPVSYAQELVPTLVSTIDPPDGVYRIRVPKGITRKVWYIQSDPKVVRPYQLKIFIIKPDDKKELVSFNYFSPGLQEAVVWTSQTGNIDLVLGDSQADTDYAVEFWEENDFNFMYTIKYMYGNSGFKLLTILPSQVDLTGPAAVELPYPQLFADPGATATYQNEAYSGPAFKTTAIFQPDAAGEPAGPVPPHQVGQKPHGLYTLTYSVEGAKCSVAHRTVRAAPVVRSRPLGPQDEPFLQTTTGSSLLATSKLGPDEEVALLGVVPPPGVTGTWEVFVRAKNSTAVRVAQGRGPAGVASAALAAGTEDPFLFRAAAGNHEVYLVHGGEKRSVGLGNQDFQLLTFAPGSSATRLVKNPTALVTGVQTGTGGALGTVLTVKGPRSGAVYFVQPPASAASFGSSTSVGVYTADLNREIFRSETFPAEVAPYYTGHQDFVLIAEDGQDVSYTLLFDGLKPYGSEGSALWTAANFDLELNGPSELALEGPLAGVDYSDAGVALTVDNQKYSGPGLVVRVEHTPPGADSPQVLASVGQTAREAGVYRVVWSVEGTFPPLAVARTITVAAFEHRGRARPLPSGEKAFVQVEGSAVGTTQTNRLGETEPVSVWACRPPAAFTMATGPWELSIRTESQEETKTAGFGSMISALEGRYTFWKHDGNHVVVLTTTRDNKQYTLGQFHLLESAGAGEVPRLVVRHPGEHPAFYCPNPLAEPGSEASSEINTSALASDVQLEVCQPPGSLAQDSVWHLLVMTRPLDASAASELVLRTSGIGSHPVLLNLTLVFRKGGDNHLVTLTAEGGGGTFVLGQDGFSLWETFEEPAAGTKPKFFLDFSVFGQALQDYIFDFAQTRVDGSYFKEKNQFRTNSEFESGDSVRTYPVGTRSPSGSWWCPAVLETAVLDPWRKVPAVVEPYDYAVPNVLLLQGQYPGVEMPKDTYLKIVSDPPPHLLSSALCYEFTGYGLDVIVHENSASFATHTETGNVAGYSFRKGTLALHTHAGKQIPCRRVVATLEWEVGTNKISFPPTGEADSWYSPVTGSSARLYRMANQAFAPSDFSWQTYFILVLDEYKLFFGTIVDAKEAYFWNAQLPTTTVHLTAGERVTCLMVVQKPTHSELIFVDEDTNGNRYLHTHRIWNMAVTNWKVNNLPFFSGNQFPRNDFWQEISGNYVRNGFALLPGWFPGNGAGLNLLVRKHGAATSVGWDKAELDAAGTTYTFTDFPSLPKRTTAKDKFDLPSAALNSSSTLLYQACNTANTSFVQSILIACSSRPSTAVGFAAESTPVATIPVFGKLLEQSFEMRTDYFRWDRAESLVVRFQTEQWRHAVPREHCVVYHISDPTTGALEWVRTAGQGGDDIFPVLDAVPAAKPAWNGRFSDFGPSAQLAQAVAASTDRTQPLDIRGTGTNGFQLQPAHNVLSNFKPTYALRAPPVRGLYLLDGSDYVSAEHPSFKITTAQLGELRATVKGVPAEFALFPKGSQEAAATYAAETSAYSVARYRIRGSGSGRLSLGGGPGPDKPPEYLYYSHRNRTLRGTPSDGTLSFKYSFRTGKCFLGVWYTDGDELRPRTWRECTFPADYNFASPPENSDPSDDVGHQQLKLATFRTPDLAKGYVVLAGIHAQMFFCIVNDEDATAGPLEFKKLITELPLHTNTSFVQLDGSTLLVSQTYYDGNSFKGAWMYQLALAQVSSSYVQFKPKAGTQQLLYARQVVVASKLTFKTWYICAPDQKLKALDSNGQSTVVLEPKGVAPVALATDGQNVFIMYYNHDPHSISFHVLQANLVDPSNVRETRETGKFLKGFSVDTSQAWPLDLGSNQLGSDSVSTYVTLSPLPKTHSADHRLLLTLHAETYGGTVSRIVSLVGTAALLSEPLAQEADSCLFFAPNAFLPATFSLSFAETGAGAEHPLLAQGKAEFRRLGGTGSASLVETYVPGPYKTSPADRLTDVVPLTNHRFVPMTALTLTDFVTKELAHQEFTDKHTAFPVSVRALLMTYQLLNLLPWTKADVSEFPWWDQQGQQHFVDVDMKGLELASVPTGNYNPNGAVTVGSEGFAAWELLEPVQKNWYPTLRSTKLGSLLLDWSGAVDCFFPVRYTQTNSKVTAAGITYAEWEKTIKLSDPTQKTKTLTAMFACGRDQCRPKYGCKLKILPKNHGATCGTTQNTNVQSCKVQLGNIDGATINIPKGIACSQVVGGSTSVERVFEIAVVGPTVVRLSVGSPYVDAGASVKIDGQQVNVGVSVSVTDGQNRAVSLEQLGQQAGTFTVKYSVRNDQNMEKFALRQVVVGQQSDGTGSDSTTQIVGGVLGGLAAAALIGVFVWYKFFRGKKNTSTESVTKNQKKKKIEQVNVGPIKTPAQKRSIEPPAAHTPIH